MINLTSIKQVANSIGKSTVERMKQIGIDSIEKLASSSIENLFIGSDEGGDIRSIAPLDQRHVVSVWPLTKEEASQLAQTYLDHFRPSESPPPNALYPFSTGAIEEICGTFKGNIRACLQAFNYAVEKGIDEGYSVIDGDFLVKHHADITGRVHADEVILKEGF